MLEGINNTTIVDVDQVVVNGGDKTSIKGKSVACVSIAKECWGQCRGQNPLDWRVPYIIEKLLELRCLKWACMTHLST